MRPGNRKPIPTIAEAVTRSAALTDPAGEDWAVTALLESFEDDERPATAAEDLRGELDSTVRGVDPEGDSPAAAMAAASALWLATNYDEGHERELVLREGARLYFGGEIPANVSDWLAAQGVDGV